MSQNESINYILNSLTPKIGWLFNSERQDYISSIGESISNSFWRSSSSTSFKICAWLHFSHGIF
jgi:hypothetical protein